MQQLHLVGLTTDLDSLIFSARKGAKSGGFTLPLDDRLLAAIADAVRRRVAEGEELEVPAELAAGGTGGGLGAALPRRQSALSPREIQDRLRAGRSLEAIAAEAGVGEEWVARFSAPVEAERRQVVGRARLLTYTKPRRGDSGEVLGMSVRWNLADKGVRLTNDEFDDGWSAYQIADHAWMVTFTFVSRKRTQVAEWEVDLGSGDLLGRNRLASELGYVEPGRRRRSLASLQPMPLLGTKGAARRASAPPVADDAEGATAAANGSARAASKRGAPTKKAASGRATAATGRKAAGSAKKAASGRAAAATGRKAAGSAKKAASGRAAVATARKAAGSAKKTASGRAASATSRKAAPGRRGAAAVTKRAAGPAKKAAAKRAATPVRKAGAGRASRPAAKKAAGATKKRSGGRGVPPAAPAPAERPVPNELGQRRLQLVTGAARPASTGRPVPTPRVTRPQPAPVRIAAPRSTEAPPPPPAPEPVLDVEDEATAEARRAERRRARALARQAQAAQEAPASPSRPAPGADVPEGDGRVVTIRANRATPPTGGESGDVILPAERPPLRPAQPAAQPRRRRFARTGR